MKNTDMSSLPPSIERQLSELELRHKAHQNKMEEQRLRKIDGPSRETPGAALPAFMPANLPCLKHRTPRTNERHSDN